MIFSCFFQKMCIFVISEIGKMKQLVNKFWWWHLQLNQVVRS